MPLRRYTACGLILLGLCGCGDRLLEHGLLEHGLSVRAVRGWFEDPQPPESSRVRRISDSKTGYPSLGEVPPRPPVPPSRGELDQRIGTLTSDNATGLESVRAWAATAPAAPVAPAAAGAATPAATASAPSAPDPSDGRTAGGAIR